MRQKFSGSYVGLAKLGGFFFARASFPLGDLEVSLIVPIFSRDGGRGTGTEPVVTRAAVDGGGGGMCTSAASGSRCCLIFSM